MAERIARLERIQSALPYIDLLAGCVAVIVTSYPVHLNLYDATHYRVGVVSVWICCLMFFVVHYIDVVIIKKLWELKQHNVPEIVDINLPADISSVLKPAEPSLSKATTCSICMEYRASICFVPCGHQCICDNCVPPLWDAAERRDENWKCPVCRAEAEEIVRPIQ